MSIQDPGELRCRRDVVLTVEIGPGQVGPPLDDAIVGGIGEEESLEDPDGLVPVSLLELPGPELEELVAVHALEGRRRGAPLEECAQEEECAGCRESSVHP